MLLNLKPQPMLNQCILGQEILAKDTKFISRINKVRALGPEIGSHSWGK